MMNKIEIAFKFASKKLGLQDIATYQIIEINDNKVRAIAYRYEYLVVFNSNWVKNANEIEILTCALHECRHLYQQACIDFSDVLFNEQDDIVNTWKKDFETYIDPNVDELLYFNRPTEVDARKFANEILNLVLGIHKR